MNWSLNLVLGGFSLWCVMQQVSLRILFGFLRLVGKRMKLFNNQIPKIESGISIHSQTRIKRDNLRFRGTVRNWNLFLAHPTHENKRVSSKHAQNFPWGRLSVCKITSKIRVLKHSQPALLCSGSHMTILLKFICVMSGPFGDCSCKFVNWPEKFKCSNTCQV